MFALLQGGDSVTLEIQRQVHRLTETRCQCWVVGEHVLKEGSQVDYYVLPVIFLSVATHKTLNDFISVL